MNFVGYPWDPSWGPDDRFWTLSCPEREIDLTIGLGDLNLVHFHTPHLNIGQREPKLLILQFALLSSSQNDQSVFTRRAFKGRRLDLGSVDLGSKGTYGIGGLSRKNM